MKKLLKWTITDIAECIELMTSKEMKFDCIIFAEGRRGQGKSTLAWKILSRLKNIERKFKPRKDIVYSREETLSHLSNKINGCIFSDEMINVAYKRDFYEGDQKELLKAFDMYRDSRNIFIGCIPLFLDLDVKIQKVCKMKISVIRRGFALIHMPLNTLYSNDPWDTRNNQKIEAKWAMRGTKNPRYGQLSTVVGYVTYGDLRPRARALYEKIKQEKRSHVFAKYQEQAEQRTPEQIFISNTTKLLREGKVNPDQFEMMCAANGKEVKAIRLAINKELTALGDKKTFKDYCLSDKKRKRLDNLGFVMPFEDRANETITNTENNDTDSASKTETYDEPNEDEDLFGFNA